MSYVIVMMICIAAALVACGYFAVADQSKFDGAVAWVRSAVARVREVFAKK